MLEEMLNLRDEDIGQIGVFFNIGIVWVELGGRHRDDFFIFPAIVFHEQHTNRASGNHATRR